MVGATEEARLNQLENQVDNGGGGAWEYLCLVRKLKARRSEKVLRHGLFILNSPIARSKLGGEEWTLYEQVAVAAMDCHRNDIANDCIEALSKKFPGSIRVGRLKGMLLEAKGAWPDAEKIYAQLLVDNPLDQPLVNGISLVFWYLLMHGKRKIIEVEGDEEDWANDDLSEDVGGKKQSTVIIVSVGRSINFSKEIMAGRKVEVLEGELGQLKTNFEEKIFDFQNQFSSIHEKMDGRFVALEELMKKMIDDKQNPTSSETIDGQGKGGNPNPSRGRENLEVEVLEGDDGMPPLEPLSREELSRGYDRQEVEYVGRREEFYRRGAGFERIQRQGADFEGGRTDFHRRGVILKRKVAIAKAQGNLAAAVEYLNNYLETFMADHDAWRELAELYISIQMYKQAAFCYEELILSQPTIPLYHLAYADVLYTMGGLENLQAAKKYYASTINLTGGKNTRALYGICLSSVAINQLTKGRNKDEKDSADLQPLAAEALLKDYKERAPEKLPLVTTMLRNIKLLS
ncbi:hypothetical protein M5K25_001763 [Dendrobium thyrsiflorum]|uniref:ER membrane protein complex subunit 2 n=1 Tax=Dendrobium thyrsiflorum TaxID=117978 RepID=A0ABD0VQW6_DENTH